MSVPGHAVFVWCRGDGGEVRGRTQPHMMSLTKGFCHTTGTAVRGLSGVNIMAAYHVRYLVSYSYNMRDLSPKAGSTRDDTCLAYHFVFLQHTRLALSMHLLWVYLYISPVVGVS